MRHGLRREQINKSMNIKGSTEILTCVSTSYLREEPFFAAELEGRLSLAFRLPVLLDELKSASLPAGKWHRHVSMSENIRRHVEIQRRFMQNEIKYKMHSQQRWLQLSL